MKSDHSFVVDLKNPGQFLACGGLLELASRLNPEAMGWFESDRFHIAGAPADLLEQFIACKVTPISDESPVSGADDDSDEKEAKSPPVCLGEPFHFRLDWWTDRAAGHSGFKTWSAGMTIPGFFNGTVTGKGEKRKENPSMRQHLARHLKAREELVLQTVEAIEKPSPFNFDSRLSRNIAIDLGFGGDITFAFSPAVELLALVGLQRFRPRMIERWKRNAYHIWSQPLPVTVAAAVAYGLIPALANKEHYVFPIKGRDAQARYKAFGHASIERTAHV